MGLPFLYKWKLPIHIFIVDHRNTSRPECEPREYPAPNLVHSVSHCLPNIRHPNLVHFVPTKYPAPNLIHFVSHYRIPGTEPCSFCVYQIPEPELHSFCVALPNPRPRTLFILCHINIPNTRPRSLFILLCSNIKDCFIWPDCRCLLFILRLGRWNYAICRVTSILIIHEEEV